MSYSKSFVKVRLIHSKTIKKCYFSWDGPYIFMRWVTRSRLWKYAWPFPKPLKMFVLAETVLTFVWDELYSKLFVKIRLIHSQTIKIFDFCWDGAYIFKSVSYLKLFVKVHLTHSRTIEISHFCWDGHYIFNEMSYPKPFVKSTLDPVPTHHNLWF